MDSVIIDPPPPPSHLLMKGEGLFRATIHTYDLSMKARTNCHIAIRLYKIAEVHLTTITKKISFTNAVLLSFVMIVLIVGKT